MVYMNGDEWFKPSEIYKEGLIRNSKNKPDYRFILRLINRGNLHAKVWNTSGSKPYFMVSKYEIDRYNGNLGQKPIQENGRLYSHLNDSDFELFVRDFVQAIKSKYISRKEIEEAIGENYKHQNGQPMKNPAYECPECAAPNLEWSLNIYKDSLRAKLLPPTKEE